MSISRLLSLLLPVLIFCGCATTPASYPLADQELLETLYKANSYHSNLKIYGRVAIKSEDGWTVSKASFLVHRPDSLRATFYNPIGTAWFLGIVNRNEISLLIPSSGVREIRRKRMNSSFRLGQLRLNTDDLIRFIHPGIEREWLFGGKAYKTASGVRLIRKEGRYDLTFNENYEISLVRVYRKGAAPFNFAYQYGAGGRVEVSLGGLVKFYLDKVDTPKTLLNQLFKSPV